MPRHGDVISQMMVSERYYMVDNDINYLKEKPKSQEEAQRKGDTFNPMHQADNRIAYSFYPLLVDQKPHTCLQRHLYLTLRMTR